MRYSMGGGLSSIPPIVKNIIIINFIVLIGQGILPSIGIDLTDHFALYFFKSEKFQPYQLITYMFMHGGISHLFFNMFAVYMFGRVLEGVWGPKRFILFYLVTGVGAAIVQNIVHLVEYNAVISKIEPGYLNQVLNEGISLAEQGKYYNDATLQKLQLLITTPTVGASGAVFGILLAFGMLFPNTRLMLLFPPIPIKAKYFVMGYGAIELYLGITQPGSSIAHFAHLGGMLFGYFMIRYWQKNNNTFY